MSKVNSPCLALDVIGATGREPLGLNRLLGYVSAPDVRLDAVTLVLACPLVHGSGDAGVGDHSCVLGRGRFGRVLVLGAGHGYRSNTILKKLVSISPEILAWPTLVTAISRRQQASVLK